MTTWTLFVTDQVGGRQAQIDTFERFRLIA